MFELIKADNRVEFFKSDIIGCPHGFSTRIGGNSTADHTASLNLAFGRGDDDHVVKENLRLFCEAVGVDERSVVSLPQIHSDRVIHVDKSRCSEGYFKPPAEECDGYVITEPGITVGVKTADCVPILFYDPENLVAGAVHAGWRGTAAKIALRCVEKMRKSGADPRNIRCAIGAAIRSCCYQVGEDFAAEIRELLGNEAAERFICSRDGGLYADIVGMNRQILLEAGVCEKNIDISEHCTCHEPELFYSHRATGGKRGTMLSVIALGGRDQM